MEIGEKLRSIFRMESVEYLMEKLQIIAALIIVVLFAFGVFDLGLLIWNAISSGEISEVQTIIELIEFVLLLFIVVEAYRTVVAYAQSRQPKYILTLVVYAGVIAVIRKIIVFRPEVTNEPIEILYITSGYGILILGLGFLLFIIDQYGNPIEEIDVNGSDK